MRLDGMVRRTDTRKSPTDCCRASSCTLSSAGLDIPRVASFCVDAVLVDCLLHDVPFNHSVIGQRFQRSHGHMVSIDLEEAAQRFAGVAASKPIGAQDAVSPGDPCTDQIADAA